MKIHIRELEDVCVLDLEGRLVTGTGDVALREAVKERLAQGDRRLLLNLSQVPTIDSSGVAELVAGLKLTESMGGRLNATRLSDRVERVLGLSQILPLLEVHETEEAAIASLRDGASA